MRTSLKVDLTYFTPQEIKISFAIPDNSSRVLYKVNERRAPSNPLKINIISPRREWDRLTEEEKNGDLIYFSGILKVDPVVVENLVEEIHDYHHSKIRNIRFEREDGVRKMCLDVDGTHPGLSFGAVSLRTQERVFIEFISALARFCGRYAPTMLIPDGLVSPFKGWFDFYSHHFLDPDNQFQTILTIPSRDIDLSNVRWNGWQVLRTSGSPSECTIAQEL